MPRRLAASMACGVLLAGAVPPIGVAAPTQVVAAASAMTRLSVHYDIRADGVLEVTETIDYDYGSYGFPLVRVVRLRQPATGHPDVPASRRGTDRVWEVTDVSASSPTGANADVEMHEWDPLLPPVVWSATDGWDSRRLELHIQIGKALPYLSPSKRDEYRPATFVVRYRVRGALERLSDGYELKWPVNLKGNHTTVVGEINARLTTPGQLISASCSGEHYADAWAASPCRTSKTGREARFTIAPIEKSHTVMEIAAQIPTAGVAGGGAIFERSPAPVRVRIGQYLIATAILVAVAIVVIQIRRRSASNRAAV